MVSPSHQSPAVDTDANEPDLLCGAVVQAALEEFGDEIFLELIDAFETDVGLAMEGLTRAIAAADPVEAGRRLHAIKGSALTMGMTAFALACAEAEERTKIGQMPVPGLLGRLSMVWRNSRTAIGAFLP